MSGKDKNSLLRSIFKMLKNVKASKTVDVLANFTSDMINHPIYTKKIKIGTEVSNNITIEYASISSSDKNFEDVGINDIRLAFLNPHDQWCNIFAAELTSEELTKVLNKINGFFEEKKKLLVSTKVEKCVDLMDDIGALVEEFEQNPEQLNNGEFNLSDFISEEEADNMLSILTKIKDRLIG